MSAKHPEVVATFLKAHNRERLTFHGAIESYDDDEHEVTFGWRAAADVLSGEDAFDDEKCVAIGFLNDDLPLFIEIGKAALPVLAIADGERLRIHASFDGFTKRLKKAEEPAKAAKVDKSAKAEKPAPAKAASKKASPADPLPGPQSVSWPNDPVVSCRVGHAIDGEDFLWFDKVSPKANNEALLRYVRPQGFRSSFAVGAKWDAKASAKYDRGTGKILDFAAYDRRTPVVTARVRDFLMAIQPKTLEFLPVRAEVAKSKVDMFIMNVKLAVPCLDAKTLEIPGMTTLFPYRMPSPRSLADGREALAVVAERVPTEPVFFRPAEYPEAILATRAMVDRLRGERFSGLDFVPLAQHDFR